MQDLLITADADGLYDLSVDEETKDFKLAQGFETAIPVSLFTDARAEAFQVHNSRFRRGWIGNLDTFAEGFELGSQQWVYDQSRNSAEVRNSLRNTVQSSLQWFVNQGIVSSVQVDDPFVSVSDTTSLFIPIVFTGLDNVLSPYVTLWRRTDANQLPNDRTTT